MNNISLGSHVILVRDITIESNTVYSGSVGVVTDFDHYFGISSKNPIVRFEYLDGRVFTLCVPYDYLILEN